MIDLTGMGFGEVIVGFTSIEIITLVVMSFVAGIIAGVYLHKWCNKK